jgi:sortase (surface protein transpeptidase)
MSATLGRRREDRTPPRRAVRRCRRLLPLPLLLTMIVLVTGCSVLGRATGHDAAGWRLSIPTIGVDAPITAVGLDGDGAMQVPDTDTVGWYRLGPRPGEPGPAVLVGHVDSRTGPAVFHRLRELRRGDRIVVHHGNGTTSTFTIRRTERHPKTALPAERIWPRTTTPLLRLITCGGSFDRAARSYRDNVIVYAAPAG